MLVLFCLGVFLGAVKACVQLETYLEDGVFTKELPEAQAQAWHKWLSALQTRWAPLLVEASLSQAAARAAIAGSYGTEATADCRNMAGTVNTAPVLPVSLTAGCSNAGATRTRSGS